VSTVKLLIPISDAIEWEPWLTDVLSEEAHSAQVGYDGGEEEGSYESHLFLDTDTDTVEAIAQRVLSQKRLDRSVDVTGDDKVTVLRRAGSSEWISVQPMPGAYGRAVRDLCKQLNAHEHMRPWLASHGYGVVTVRQAPGGRQEKALFQAAPADGSPDELFMIAPVDLSVYEEGTTTGRPSQLLARENMRSILDRLAAHLGSSLPEALPDVDS